MQKKHTFKKIDKNIQNEEVSLSGRAVSRGIGIGKTLCLHGKKRQFYRVKLNNSQLDKEIRRFNAAVRLARIQLKIIASPNSAKVGENQTSIFETHQLFLSDKSLLNKIETTIIEQKVNAEWAVKNVTDSYISKYKSLSDKHLREKYIDLEDITERLLTALGGGQRSSVKFDDDTIIIAKEINPSTLIELSENNPKALVTENGGWTSHTFILAREMNIPAITGVTNILRQVESGEEIIVDGYSGKIFLSPTAKTKQSYKLSEEKAELNRNLVSIEKINTLKTLDGFEITVRANIDLADKYLQAKESGAKGIGLFRSEFLFNQNRGYPTEQEQFESYKKIAELVGDDGVRIRTFDLSLEQLAIQGGEKEKNPALGLRGIRLSKKFEEEFYLQIKAILKASYNTNIDIVIPLVSDVSEIIWARKVLETEREKLKKNGVRCGNPRLGAMIEVPASVFIVDEILKESDFLSIGTNDLVQYILAVDRDNELVADWFNTLHPAVLRCIKTILESASKHNKQAIICGEMAGSPLYVPILIAYGAKDLSMNLNSISRIQKIISGIAREEAIKIVKDLELCQTAEEVEETVKANFSETWSHLFEPDVTFYQQNENN